LTERANPTQKTFNPALGITGEDIPNVHKLQFSLGSNYARPRHGQRRRAEVSAINSAQDPGALVTVRPRTVALTVTRRF